MARTSRPTQHTAQTLEALVGQLRSEIEELARRVALMRAANVDTVMVSEGQAEVERAINGMKVFWKKLDTAITDRRKELHHFGSPVPESEPQK